MDVEAEAERDEREVLDGMEDKEEGGWADAVAAACLRRWVLRKECARRRRMCRAEKTRSHVGSDFWSVESVEEDASLST